MKYDIRISNQTFEVAVRKEDKKHKVFLHFLSFLTSV